MITNVLSPSAYAAPDLEVLGQLTDLAEGVGEGGALIVMQSFTPVVP